MFGKWYEMALAFCFAFLHNLHLKYVYIKILTGKFDIQWYVDPYFCTLKAVYNIFVMSRAV